jgi:hypothetical protein
MDESGCPLPHSITEFFYPLREKTSRRKNCLGRETDRVSPARDATEVDLFLIVARSERLVDGRMGKFNRSRRKLYG